MNFKLPIGVRSIPLKAHQDERGWLAEIFREEWTSDLHLVQWNCVFSHPNVLRGVHVHPKHWDYLVLLKGKMLLGLKDLRSDSETFGLSSMVELLESSLTAWTIPPGVAHGFFFPVESMFCYSVSEYWNLNDELGCRWDDPELELDWPVSEPLLSERDRQAPPLKELMSHFNKA
ncbi:MAG: dTDP-4-dehydrorhamnose 3,5-epimerase family protein [Candidatus Contendobacter sp.]|nr:dTDP-4-dehydrorhamnose 3,5-epimerase family protein [Candidatus Contendobacter sp.]MDG4559367.1 dTDP-4-dehydrorhamnose 3,5-epimerase family protein [Candidatus Contendobacter sp.]